MNKMFGICLWYRLNQNVYTDQNTRCYESRITILKIV